MITPLNPFIIISLGVSKIQKVKPLLVFFYLFWGRGDNAPKYPNTRFKKMG